MAVLHDELVAGQRGEPVDEPVERVVVGPEGHEDHRRFPAWTALRRRPAAPGHWTKNTLANG